MRRTQIYVTEEQDRRISQIAADEQISKAEVIRRILDAALDAGDPEQESRTVIRETAGICADYPDWPEWLRSVRGRSAHERLRSLGL